MQQPSAQGIAALYRGNPQPLQQVIQNEQKAKPGLPPDLQKLLALQIVTNEKDSATAQQAMQQLQQMGGGQGQPPTVMQSLQEQAKQKMQTQAMQAQRQQQGLQALAQRAPMGAVPEGTPQPQEQPQARGIDQLPAEFGMAGGGIVAFNGEDGSEVPYDQATATRRADYAEPGAAQEAPATLSDAQKIMLKQAIEQLKSNPNDAFRSGAERHRQYAGIEELLKGNEGRIAEREKRQAEAKTQRSPTWVEGLAALGGAPVRGGIGMLLGKAGAAAGAAREAYGAEDMKFADKIDALKDEVTKARIEGRYKDAAAGEAAIRNAAADKRQAEQSVTSMVTNEQNVQDRQLRAKEGAANRAALAANATTEKERIMNRILELQKKGTPEAAAEADRLQKAYMSLQGGSASVGSERNTIRIYEGMKKDANKVLADYRSTDEERAAAREDIADANRQLAKLRSNLPDGSGDAEAVALPANATADTLKDGQLYNTAQGKARWNAATKKFTQVQ